MTESHLPASLANLRPKPLVIRQLTDGPPVVERRDPIARETLVRRVRGEFDEMPGLRLTLPQAQRLFSLRKDICERVLNTLAALGIVARTPDGHYARRDVAA